MHSNRSATAAMLVRPYLERLETRNVSALLYNNGPYITGFGNGFGGADTSEIEFSSTAYGWASYKSQGVEYHLADDFTVPAGQSWHVSQIKVLSYQTNSGTSNTFTKLHYRIWSGNPSSGGTITVDCTRRNAINTDDSKVLFTNVYRVAQDNLLSSARALKQVTGNSCAANELSSGTYWVEWWLEGKANYSGPWSNPKVPHAATDNAQQYYADAGTWYTLADGKRKSPVDFPFEIHGRVATELTSLDPGDATDEWDVGFPAMASNITLRSLPELISLLETTTPRTLAAKGDVGSHALPPQPADGVALLSVAVTFASPTA